MIFGLVQVVKPQWPTLGNMEIPILYGDDHFIAVNKPAGTLTIKDGYNPNKPYLIAELEKSFGKLFVVHRLDRDTSGVLMIARTPTCHKGLNDLFENRKLEKIYHLIAAGNPEWNFTGIELPLRANAGNRHRTVVDLLHGKPAKTELEIIKRLTDTCYLIMASPHTGYTHQIRVHLTSIGLWILNDLLYSPKVFTGRTGIGHYHLPEKYRIAATQFPIHRLALHAYCLRFVHPVTGESMVIEAPYPDDFKAAVDHQLLV